MIQIKRNNKVFFTLEDFGEGSKLSYQLMDHHYIILKFTTATPIYFEIGDSVEIPDFGYFELTSSYFPKHNDSDGYDYEMQMDAYYMSWKNKLCKYRPQHGANETSFSLTTTVGVHMNVILGNLKALGLTYNGKDFSVDYTTYNNKAFDVQKRFLIEYGSISILDALNAICSEDALNCEWWIDGSIIYLGYCEMEGQTTFEQDVNVLSMSYSESKSTYITRLYAFGSDRNIPKGYFTGADADVTTDGVATDYLMLPNKEVDSDGFYAKNGYLENVNVVKNDKQAIEGVVMFEEEYPKVESVVSSIKTYDSTVNNEDGTKTTQTFWQVTSTDSFTNNFKKNWIKSNLTLGIKFTSGALMGMEFDVSFKVIDKVNYFEIVANDTYGRTLPDGVMCPKVGDKYFLFNWDATKITDTDLIPTAQLSLFDRAKQYYQKTMISNSNFTCTMDGDKFYNDGIYDYHPLGEQVKLINDMFAQVDADGKHYRNSRIIGMEIPLDIPYDHPQYIVGEKAATSRLGKLEDKVDSIKVNGMQIGGTGSGNGGGVYVIGMNDTTPASDSNVYSARRSRMEFVSRLQDNTAKSTITWEKVQKFLGGLLVGNSNNENGGSWIPDAEGRSHLITDYLEVRMKAIFEELVIKETSTIGGKEIISPAGGVVAHKVEEVTVTYNNVSQKAYRCYFLAEQEGDSVDNDFAIDDQVRSESFNVRKGTYHKVGNHFHWRLVIGRDEEPVELEGKKYHYIDLSDTDCATASDVPAKGDVLNQCGNRTDVERQNCLIFSAVDTYSPSISLYHGINSYSFANKEYVEYGVNKQTNKAFFNVYGDMYVGDRPTKENGYEGSSYIKYDSAAKQVSIKGKLSAKSTVDGKELSQYIKENSAKGLTEEQVNNLIKNSQVITDLQNQVDGAIETWFYEGVPTLKNAPASSWATDKEKDTHLGDLYYDNKTGKAYRFAKDGNTYKWTIITDTDIAKALSDASKAQETADGKMKVFSTQPNPPYQVGDIWVNATYPADGSTYKNEVLRCQTAKGAGSQFAIGDWIKASKYTDDTVANAAKAAAEKAQKAAEKAQGDISKLGTTVTTNKKAFDSYVTDGYLEPSEIAAMAQDSKRLEDAFAAAEKSYNEVKGAEVLKSTKELTDLNTAFTTLSTAKTELIKYLSDISKRYNASDTNGKAIIVSAVGTKFTNFQSAYSAFYDKLGLANAYITSKIYGDLKQNITDLAGYKYLKDALGQTTDIDGGLVMTTLLALRDADGNVQSGINGAIDPNRGKKSIATWWGGQMVDKDYNSGNLTPATSLIRFDGSGYLANGAIWWDVSGKVHADPTSFIISEKNLGAYLTFFEPTWKEGSAGTSVADLVSLKPNAPFSKLGVSGDATFEGAISFHGIKITYDATNKAIKIDGNLYATGGITAYGAGASTTGGGGLIASVISYARIIEGNYTDADLTSIPNAYAIKALSSRIDNIASELGGLSLSWNNITGKPSTFTPSAHTHKWTEITDRITKVSQLTNDAGYLTAHQSLASYYTKAEIDAKGYTTNKGTVTSVALTLPTGLTCATKTITTSGTFAISLTSGYSIPTTAKQTAWDGAVSAKHTHSNKSVLDGISSTKVSHWDSAYGWYALMTTDEETADGIINKWNEVVSFLANIAQTDTLSGIVDGINKSISDEVARAKKAEGVNASGISTNKTSITTLQGYFTSGSAKKALQLTNTRKLWGNSFNGTADINGSIIVPDGKYISIGNIKMEYDATNKALKITNTTTNEVANLYATGGISAYGEGSAGTTGSNNFSAKAYADSIKLTSENLSEIASAYSIAVLNNSLNAAIGRISTLEGGSATSIETTGSGNAVTSVSKSGTKITFTKGSTFSLNGHTHTFASLTSKPSSLSGYGITDGVNAVSVTGSGNAVTSVTKNGTTISVVKGSTFSLSGHTHKWADITDRPSSLKNPSALSWSGYSSGSYDGSAAKSISIPNNTNQLTNGAGFITASASITGNAATATKVNHSLSVFGKSFNGLADVTVADTDLIASISTATANLTDKTEILTSWASDNGFNDSNAKNRIHRRPASAIWGYINSKTISNADKLDNVHLNGIFTALSNTNNGVSMTIGTVAKSLANMQVYSATKLVTARNIALNGDLTGNANFDGSANITINGYMSYCNATASNTNTYPWRRIAKVNEITGNYADGCILLYISEGFNGGYYGIARVYIRTDNLSTGANASCSIQWISRNGYGLDSLKIAMYKTTGKAYYDVFLKMSGAYGSVVIRTLQDRRGGLGKRFSLVNSTETTNAASHTEAYATIEDAATAIHNQAYTSIVQGTDVATVHNADMVDGIHASGLFTNLSNSGNSLSITVGGTNKTLTVNYASNAGNADTVDSLHVHSGRNSEANKIVRTDGNGFIQCGYINSDKGNEGNNSSPARVWGTNGSDNYLRSYLTSALSVKYAASAGNADTLDGVHASGLFTNLSNSGNNISITIGGTNKTLTAAYATNCDTVDGYHAQLGSSKPYGKIPVIGTDGVIELGHYIDFHHDNTTGSDYSVRLQTNGNHSNVVTLPTATGTLALTSGNVASATKLQTARTIWGQSFNGTANVSGALSGATTISASNTISTTLQNGALKIGNKLTPISAIDAQVIFNTGAAIRFGETAWDWNQWAGLKYTHSNKTVYLGIADGSVFNANKAQSYGKLQLKAIDRILFDSDSDNFQIYCDNSYDCLRIGSSDNSGYVLVSDIGNWDIDGEDEYGANNWRISIDGSSLFKKISCPSIYTADSITSTSNKALLLSGNVIREYHHGGSLYYSSITFKDTTLDLSAYGNIGLTSVQGITINGGNGTISMVATGGFGVTYRAASLSVSQTGASEYTWTFNNGSIKTTGGITAYQSSDERLKHNIHGVDSLAIIKAMGGTVAFRYNEDDKASIGWIAQRVLRNTLMQDLVEKDEDGYLKINYWSPKLIAVAFGAIEQVDDEVAKLKARVRELENEVEQLKNDRL